MTATMENVYYIEGIEVEPQDEYTSMDIVRLTGISYRQLDYAIRQGYITPDRSSAHPGTGDTRRFSIHALRKVFQYFAGCPECGCRAAHG